MHMLVVIEICHDTYLFYTIIFLSLLQVAMQSPKIIKMSSCALLQITRTFLELEGKYKQLTDILDKFRVFVTDLPTTCTSDELSKGKNIRCKIKITIFSVVIYADIDLTLRH